jgi:hypothetical protein
MEELAGFGAARSTPWQFLLRFKKRSLDFRLAEQLQSFSHSGRDGAFF